MDYYDTLLVIFKWILEAIYAAIAVIALVQIVLAYKRYDKFKSSKPRYIYVLIFLACVVRAVLMGIPFEIYQNVISEHTTAQMILDLLPELLFFSVYYMLFIIWVEMYYFSKKNSKLDSNFITRRMWFAFVGGNLFVYVVGLILAIVEGPIPYSFATIKIEGYFLSLLSWVILVPFCFYGYLLFKLISVPVRIMISTMKRRILRRLQGLLATCLICFIVHSIWIVILGEHISAIMKYFGENYIYVWFFYFVITEQLPVILILYFISVLTSTKKNQTSKMVKPLLSSSRATTNDDSIENSASFSASFST